MLERRTLVDRLLRHRPDNALTVSSLGSPTWDIASTGDNPLHFGFIGAMGQAAPFALGLAMAEPNKRVVLFAGDGELLMSLGILATIANKAPANLAIVSLDNESYGETGGQSTATAGPTDLEAVAKACGFSQTCTATSEEALDAVCDQVWTAKGPAFINLKIVCGPSPLVFPHSFDGATAMNRFRDAINKLGQTQGSYGRSNESEI
ncbi:MAG: aldehyde dehydrogenase [Acidiferrobacteraceae bacterium]|jgi:thiamine pyrophosphate-dependent acetolactate synthase large subunit-like protein|nr:aldehyde dehydrogenase [Acidiferrobacteraceae bacterium]MDP6397562.1 thiamine pyrophosphate-dependent enzyme [Arenicellales bacterium]MDP6551983.1 thiamine pyrophosphate-dependent enzyme [Arenicellales bacterium]MDP6919124.1 thiamine pyrophosphate-dependent enzyme [Arenicellales bacterium]|tara:strand:+ start:1031 stop:1648 length:618 start_codon:yes stop_codon:yes gene_type:complete